MSGERLVQDAVVNVRGGRGGPPFLTLDGEPFPYSIARNQTNGGPAITVEASDDNVHLVKVTIQVDRSVTIIDQSLPEGDY